MFKRLDRKRKRLPDDVSDSDSDSEYDTGKDTDQEAVSEDEGVGDDPPITVSEALNEPLYLISDDPTVHGCVLCRGKLIKNTGMAAAHKKSIAHQRRFEHFRLLAVDTSPRSSAWELVREIHSTSHVQTAKSEELSKRATKRQVKQAAIREKRKRHKELKAKAIAKSAFKKISTVDKAAAPSTVNLQRPESQIQPEKVRKKKKLEGNSPSSTTMESRNVTEKSSSRIDTLNRKKSSNPRLKGARRS